MKYTDIIFIVIKTYFRILIYCSAAFFASGCVSTELKLSEFEFVYNNQRYLIRSAYCPGNPESCNQIIGNDLIAVDLNQDRIIDEIKKGNTSLIEAQQIYDYCLGILESQNKLNKVSSTAERFFLSESKFDYEIKTLYPKVNTPINEFTITDKKNSLGLYEIFVFFDEGADGVLDTIVKGDFPLEEAQAVYDRIILEGLIGKDLIKIDAAIIVNKTK